MTEERKLYERMITIKADLEKAETNCEEIIAKAKQDNAEEFDKVEALKAELKDVETQFNEALITAHKNGNDVTADGTIKVRKSSSTQDVFKNMFAKKKDDDNAKIVNAIYGVGTEFSTYFAVYTSVFLKKGKCTNTELAKIEPEFKALGFNDADAKTLASAVVIKDEKENLSYEPSTTATATATADTSTAVDDLF